METKKNTKFFITFGLILFASFGFIAIATMDYKSYHEVSYPNNNLALPDLTGKTEISPNVYRLYESFGITVDYNINDGFFIMNGTNTQSPLGTVFILKTTLQNGKYTISRQEYNQNQLINIYVNSPLINLLTYYDDNETHELTSTHKEIIFSDIPITTFNDYKFKLQISKGSYLLPYVVPKETIIYQHNQDYSALTEIGSVAITSLTGFINGFKVVGDILQTLVQFQQTVVYEVSKFLIENYLKVIDFIEAITDNGLIEWIKDPMKGFRF